MDSHRYSENYVLKFSLISTDEKRKKIYKYLNRIMAVILLLWEISIVLGFFPFEGVAGTLLMGFRSIGIVLYIALLLYANKYKYAGDIFMDGQGFRIVFNGSEHIFELKNLKNLALNFNEDGIPGGYWKIMSLGLAALFVTPDNKGNFLEFDDETGHHFYEIKLKNDSQALLLERRLMEWKKNFNII